MGDATPGLTGWRTGAALGGVVAVAIAAAWALGHPQNPLDDTVIRVITDVAAVMTIGLIAVPWFDTARFRSELAARAAPVLIGCAAVWATAELARFVITAAEVAGESSATLSVRTTVDFATATAAGRAAVVCAVAAAVVLALVLARPRATRGRLVMVGVAAIGIVGRYVVGHASASVAGGLAVAVHALAAALWCGSLAGLALTVGRRGQWARVLPRFSQAALVCVTVLLVCGVAAAATTLASPAALYETGYGRLLAAKIAVTIGLTILAWRNRTVWLPSARAHRTLGETSKRRSRFELATMAVALVLAAALAVTG